MRLARLFSILAFLRPEVNYNRLQTYPKPVCLLFLNQVDFQIGFGSIFLAWKTCRSWFGLSFYYDETKTLYVRGLRPIKDTQLPVVKNTIPNPFRV